MIKIYGKNAIYEALRANAPLEKVFLSDFVLKKDNNIVDILSKKGYNYEILNKDILDKKFPQNQGYAALREDYKIYHEEDLDKFYRERGRILLLDGIQDPHNLGAILRSVDAFGYDLVIIPKNRSASINEVVAHTSTGAIEHVSIMLVNSLNNVVEKLKKNNYWICGTDASGDVLTEDIDPNLSLGIIIGSEGFGMSRTLVLKSDFLITIPMVGHVNSLNASVSTGIVLKDLMRRD